MVWIRMKRKKTLFQRSTKHFENIVRIRINKTIAETVSMKRLNIAFARYSNVSYVYTNIGYSNSGQLHMVFK